MKTLLVVLALSAMSFAGVTKSVSKHVVKPAAKVTFRASKKAVKTSAKVVAGSAKLVARAAY